MAGEKQDGPLQPHAYDGIQEYDNPLPGWWVWIFWATILFSVGYWAWYQIGEGPSIHQIYDQEMADYYAQQAAEMAKLGKVDDAMLRGMQQNGSTMAVASAMFVARCVVCHGEHAEGKIGPNLTDDYWLHGGKLTDIYHTITEGVPEKGMISWKTQLAPTDIMQLAAYVGSLRGSNPANGKEPQGTKELP